MEAEAVPDAWVAAADVVRQELAERSLRAAGSLSADAWMVAMGLAAAEGEVPVVYVRRVLDRTLCGACDFDAGMDELLDLGLVETFWAAEMGLWRPRLVARLRSDVELPGTE
jgi:hypothetical protein